MTIKLVLDDKEFYELIKDVINKEKYIKQKEFISHGNTNLYEHQIFVAYECYKYLKKKKIMDIDMIYAALLHDYYLYDWHNRKKYPRKRLHGFRHPKIAALNAFSDYKISKKCMSMIKSHMFPLTLLHFPKSKLAFVLARLDKKVTIIEMKSKNYD